MIFYYRFPNSRLPVKRRTERLRKVHSLPLSHSHTALVLAPNNGARTQTVEKVCFISRSGEPPARVLLILTVLTVKISPFLRFMKEKEFRCLRTATKDSVFGNCKPLKRLDLNFHKGFCDKLKGRLSPSLIFINLQFP